MEIYILNIVLLLVIGVLIEKASHTQRALKIYCIYAWLQMTIIAAIRLDTGIDYSQYYHAFYDIAEAGSWAEIFSLRYEPGFLIIARMISVITENIVVFMAVYHGIMYGLLMWYIYKYCEEKWISILMFIALDYYALSFCFMRQCMAMIIGFFAIEQMRRQKWYFVIPCVLIASCFHISALILLLYYLISYIKWEKRWVQVTAIVLSVVAYVGCDFFLEKCLIGPFARYKDYLNSVFMEGNPILIVFYPVFVVVLFFVFCKKNGGKEQKYNQRLVPMLFLGAFLTILSTKHYIIERTALYMMIYNIRLVPMIVHKFYRKKQNWNYHLAVISTLIISMSAFIFGITCDRYWIVPYKIAEEQIELVPLFKGMDALTK